MSKKTISYTHSNRLLAIIAFCLVILMSSCYTRTEGCLDLLASNYDVSADDGCETCCTFPSILLNLNHEVDGVKYKADSLLKNDLGQFYLLSDIKFYVSDFTLTSTSNVNYKILEEICTLDKVYCIEDDVKIIRSATPQLKIGTVKASGEFNGLIYHLGLDTSYSNKTFLNLSNTHPLAPASKIINVNNEVVDFSFNVSKYEFKNDTTVLKKTDNYRLSLKGNPLQFLNNVPLNTRKGDNIIYNLKINYGVLMSGINLDSSANYNSSLVLKNLPNLIK